MPHAKLGNKGLFCDELNNNHSVLLKCWPVSAPYSMIKVTKIFHFETAHALHGYHGACRMIHGHSYVLHVTVTSTFGNGDDYLPAQGILLDFKELKKLVNDVVVNQLDHKLVLSRAYLASHPGIATEENLVTWDVEPSAENLLIFARKVICDALPAGISLHALRLYETMDSYAEWVAHTG